MSAFNTLVATVPCAVCSYVGEFQIQFKYGDTWQYRYNLGDTIRWGGNDYGQPHSGLIRIEGIGDSCPNCSADALPFVIMVRNNRLEAVIPQPLTASNDHSPPGHE